MSALVSNRHRMTLIDWINIGVGTVIVVVFFLFFAHPVNSTEPNPRPVPS